MLFFLTSCNKECIALHYNNNYDGDFMVLPTFITALFMLILICPATIYTYKKNKKLTKENEFLKEELNKIKEELRIHQEEKDTNSNNADESALHSDEQHEPASKPLQEFDIETMDLIEKAMEEQQLYVIQDLNVKLLADKMKITQKKILEVFRHHPEYANFNTYLNRKRIIHACTLFNQHPEYTVEGIAGESGFSSPITFYRWFEKEMGMKPKEYREKALKDKKDNT